MSDTTYTLEKYMIGRGIYGRAVVMKEDYDYREALADGSE